MHCSINPEYHSDFRTMALRAQLRGGRLYLSPEGDGRTFDEMYAKRRRVERGDIYPKLINGGHVFANIGISVLLTLDLDGNSYLLVERKGDQIKPITEYVGAEELNDFRTAAYRALAEEVIFFDEKGGRMRFYAQDNRITDPFGLFEYGDRRVDVVEKPRFTIGGLANALDKEYNRLPDVYIHTGTNSLQAVVGFHLVPDSPVRYIKHCEDKRGPNGSFIEIRDHGIALVRLDSGMLTTDVSCLSEGSCHSINPETLSIHRDFAPKPDSIVDVDSMSYIEFLRMHQR